MPSSREPFVRIVTAGRNRLVILVGRWALKVPSMRCWRDFLFGLLNNLTERDRSRSGVLPAACPVLWCAPGGFVLVMPRARMLTPAEFASLDYGTVVGDRCSVEHKPDSFGIVDGRLVVLDYGW